jgi:hypothetical protein
MTMRRQAPRLCEPLANLSFSVILTLFLTLPSLVVQAGTTAPQAIGAGQFNPGTLLTLALLSAVTLVLWRYHRRDYASPRRIGRRI